MLGNRTRGIVFPLCSGRKRHNGMPMSSGIQVTSFRAARERAPHNYLSLTLVTVILLLCCERRRRRRPPVPLWPPCPPKTENFRVGRVSRARTGPVANTRRSGVFPFSGYGELIDAHQRLQLQLKKNGIHFGGNRSDPGVAVIQCLLLNPEFVRVLSVHNKVQQLWPPTTTKKPATLESQNLLRDVSCVAFPSIPPPLLSGIFGSVLQGRGCRIMYKDNNVTTPLCFFSVSRASTTASRPKRRNSPSCCRSWRSKACSGRTTP